MLAWAHKLIPGSHPPENISQERAYRRFVHFGSPNAYLTNKDRLCEERTTILSIVDFHFGLA